MYPPVDFTRGGIALSEFRRQLEMVTDSPSAVLW